MVDSDILWDTATDWDNAASESKVVHESVGDHASGWVELGYPTSGLDLSGGGPAIYWSCHDAGSPVVNDGSVAGMDLGEHGTPSYDAGGLYGGSSIKYDGSSDYHDISSDPGLTLPATLVAWVYPTVNQNAAVCGSLDYGIELARQSSSNTTSGWQWYMRASTGGTIEAVDTQVDAPANTWQHVGFTVQASSSPGMEFFKNGTSSASGGPTESSFSKSDTRFHIGQRGGYYFGGRVAEVMIFDYKLTSSDFTALYDRSPGSLTTDKRTQ